MYPLNNDAMMIIGTFERARKVIVDRNVYLHE